MPIQNLYETLATKSVEELRDLARKQGMTPHHRAKAETLARQIAEHVAVKPVPQAQQEPIAKPTPHMHSEDEIRDILAPFKNIRVEFPGDGTFVMRNGRAEDSLHMTTPREVILSPKHAVLINRGELRPISMDEAARRGAAKVVCMG